MRYFLPVILMAITCCYIYYITIIFSKNQAGEKTQNDSSQTVDTSIWIVKAKTVFKPDYSISDSSNEYIKVWTEYQNERWLELQSQSLYSGTGEAKYKKEFYYHQKRRIALAKKAERLNKWLNFKKP